MKTKMMFGVLCAVAIGFLGCSDSKKVESDVDQSDPVIVAKAWWTSATEENADRLLALTAEEAREEMKNGIIPNLSKIAAYKGKPIDAVPRKMGSTELVEYTEKDGMKFAKVCVVLGAGTEKENSQNSRLVCKDGKWFVTSKR